MRLRCSKEKDQSIARQVELELQMFYGHKWKMGQGEIIKRLLFSLKNVVKDFENY